MTRSDAGGNYQANVENCLRSRDDNERILCIGQNLFVEITRIEGDRSRCPEIPTTLPRLRDACERAFPIPIEITRPADANAIPQSRFRNVLLERDENGAWIDRAERRGLDVSFWTWNAKFADFDLDGWQDLYAATGVVLAPRWEPNLYFRNDGKGRFHEMTEKAGLIDYLPTSSYVVADFDGDGDPDIVSRPLLGPLRFFENKTSYDGAKAVTFELRDLRGNRFGIGSMITAHLPDGTRQIREIKASGGFQSFDPAEARFGLGVLEAIRRVDVRWSTGETSRLDGPFSAGARYRIMRTASTSEN